MHTVAISIDLGSSEHGSELHEYILALAVNCSGHYVPGVGTMPDDVSVAESMARRYVYRARINPDGTQRLEGARAETIPESVAAEWFVAFKRLKLLRGESPVDAMYREIDCDIWHETGQALAELLADGGE